MFFHIVVTKACTTPIIVFVRLQLEICKLFWPVLLVIFLAIFLNLSNVGRLLASVIFHQANRALSRALKCMVACFNLGSLVNPLLSGLSLNRYATSVPLSNNCREQNSSNSRTIL